MTNVCPTYLITGEPRAPVAYLVHANFTEVVHGTRRRADDDARCGRGGVDEFAQRMRVLEVFMVDEPHRAAHQMARRPDRGGEKEDAHDCLARERPLDQGVHDEDDCDDREEDAVDVHVW